MIVERKRPIKVSKCYSTTTKLAVRFRLRDIASNDPSPEGSKTRFELACHHPARGVSE
jgi:hypothetical protein